MKKILLCGFAICILFSSGCVNRYFKYTVNLNTSGTWHIDQTGAFNSTSFLTAKLDIPNDADILEVDIESLTLKPLRYVDHTATSIQAEGRLNGNILFPLQTFEFDVDVPLIGRIGIEEVPDGLIQSEVEKLRQTIASFIKNKQFPPGTTVSFVGTTQGGRAHLAVDYSIKATVKYGRCEEVLEVLGDVAQPCPGK